MSWQILVVDDHAGFRSMARALLEVDGFAEVREAAGGIDALRMADEAHPDLVLLDVQLPDLDGFAVCERLLEASDPPVVLLTSVRPARVYRRRLDRVGWPFVTKADLSTELVASLLNARLD